MNILVLAPQPFYENRGTPIATRQLLQTLSDEGHTLDVLTYHIGQNLSIPRCRIYRIRRIPGIRRMPAGPSLKKMICDIVMLFTLIGMLMRRRWDVIHAVEESVFMALFVKFFFRIPYVYDMDSSLPLQLSEKYAALCLILKPLTWMEALAVRNSVGVVAVCAALEERAAQHSPETPIVRIEDTSLLQDVSGDEDLGRALSITGPRVMYVGNLERYQGIDLLLDAFVHVFHRVSDAHLIVIGGSAEHIKKYRKKAASFEVASRIHFVGPRPSDQLGHYLRQADILVSPRTKGNNTPMKIYSYLDSGKPVLATRLPTHTQVLDEDISLLVDPNPLSMAAGLQSLLESPELQRQLAARAQRRIQEAYTQEIMQAKLAAFYEDAVSPWITLPKPCLLPSESTQAVSS